MKIVCISTSPRYSKILEGRIEKLMKYKDVSEAVYDIGYEGKISNSQGLLIAAAWGASREGAEVEFIYPGDKVPEFDGVLMSSPVYFGDRSSHLHDFIRNTDLKDKAVGIVSSGAKRNGGQETTNIYALYDCLNKGAIITGNGPPTAQYGGTGWAGNKTAIVNDDFGIQTSTGTGRQLAKLTNMISLPEDKNKPTILFLVVNHGKFKFPYKSFKNCNVDVVDITDKHIRRCAACPVCPNGDLEKEFTCILTNDDLPEIHKHIIKSDCVIYVSNTNNAPVDMYQIFMERSRFIRRNHFEWAERVYSSISSTNSITDIFPIRVMTSMLRHNMFGLPFFRDYRGSRNTNIKDYISVVEKYVRKSMAMRKLSNVDFEYTAVGYEDAKRDDKAYRD